VASIIGIKGMEDGGEGELTVSRRGHKQRECLLGRGGHKVKTPLDFWIEDPQNKGEGSGDVFNLKEFEFRGKMRGQSESVSFVGHLKNRSSAGIK